jgi:hypothetical protein
MSAIWPVAMHDRSRMPELRPDLETETVHAVERMTMHAAEVTLFGMCGRRAPACALTAHLTEDASMLLSPGERHKFRELRAQPKSAVRAVQAWVISGQPRIDII